MIAAKAGLGKRSRGVDLPSVGSRDAGVEASAAGLPGEAMCEVELTLTLTEVQREALLGVVGENAKGSKRPLVLVVTPGSIVKAGARNVPAESVARPPENLVPPAETIRVREMTIIPGRHEVLVREKPCPPLTHTEFDILSLLARHAGWVFSREQIVDAVKGHDYPVTTRAVDVQIAGLRKKLGSAASYVQTVRGVGYRLRD